MKNQLAECLAAKEMKKSQLAHRLHMSRAYVTRLVKGEIHPRLETAIRIARLLRKPVEEIFQLQEANPALNANAQVAVPSVSQINFPDAPPSASGEPVNNGGKSKKQHEIKAVSSNAGVPKLASHEGSSGVHLA